MFLDEIPAAIPNAALEQRCGITFSNRPPPNSTASVAASGQPGTNQMASSVGLRLDVTGQAPTRTIGTIHQYRETVESLIKQAGARPAFDHQDRIHATVWWFSRQHGSWKPRTIRRYRAALIWAVESAAESGLLENGPEELLEVLEQGLVRRPKGDPARTSAKKRKHLTPAEFTTIYFHLKAGKTKTARLVAGVVAFAVLLGLRPIEFFTASLVGDRLFVRCAKNTNGRALGHLRVIELRGFTPGQLAGLDETLCLLRQAVKEADFIETVTERLSKTLYRACEKLGIEPISLYTCRHQAIANAKLFMTRREIAALAGHISVDTTSRHYGRRAGGWGSAPICSPSPETIGAVRHRSELKPVPTTLNEAISDLAMCKL